MFEMLAVVRVDLTGELIDVSYQREVTIFEAAEDLNDLVNIGNTFLWMTLKIKTLNLLIIKTIEVENGLERVEQCLFCSIVPRVMFHPIKIQNFETKQNVKNHETETEII